MMASMTLRSVAQAVSASFNGIDEPVLGVSMDSRSVAAGDLFAAIPGDRVDGHDFVESAAGQGAVAALVERPVTASIPCLEVADVRRALAEIATENRRRYDGELVAITGSCGKTSVKNISRAIFSTAGSTLATRGNYNNELGVPLTLARLDDDTRYAIVEMGATRRGDIAHLCDLAKPRISTVLNAMEAHLSGFGSVEEVAAVKGEIFDGLGASGCAVINGDEPWADAWERRARASGAAILRWSLASPADLWVSDLQTRDLAGSVFTLHIEDRALQVELPLPGRHNVANAVAAAGLAFAAGVTPECIVAGLAAAQGEPGRMSVETLADGTVLIDDSYNANPGSVRAAIEFLAQRPGSRTLVLGEMRELGDDSQQRHRDMGEAARAAGVDRFIGVGAALAHAVEAFGAGARWFPSRDALEGELGAVLAGSDTLLLKGSRGAAMETLVDALRAAARSGAEQSAAGQESTSC